jgi:hypothetical protein
VAAEAAAAAAAAAIQMFAEDSNVRPEVEPGNVARAARAVAVGMCKGRDVAMVKLRRVLLEDSQRGGLAALWMTKMKAKMSWRRRRRRQTQRQRQKGMNRAILMKRPRIQTLAATSLGLKIGVS